MTSASSFRGLFFSALATFLTIEPQAYAQKAEEVNGVRIIHNKKEGAWGENPAVRLELIRTFGGAETMDPNLALGAPYDVVVDSKGHIYILDQRNCRIQKFSPEGTFVQSIGRQGQGPGDFQAPFSMDIDDADRLYVFDHGNRRIQVMTSEGKAERGIKLSSVSMDKVRLLKSGDIVLGGWADLRRLIRSGKKISPLLTVIDSKGKMHRAFGEMQDFRDANVNSYGNWIDLDVDREDNVCVSFRHQNRVERYSVDGSLQWKADRILNYGTEVIDKGYVHQDYGGIRIQLPTFNEVAEGIAADGKGQIWMITLNRQLARKEMGEEVVAPGGRRRMVEPEIKKMDIYKLEVFGPDGILLGSLPLDHAAHGIRICGDSLFLWERNTATVYQYEIMEH